MREKKFLARLNKDERLLIIFSAFHGIAQVFLGTFVVSFLIRNSINEIVSVSLYDLFFYLAIMLSFVLMVDRCKRGNLKIVFASHIIVQIILILLIALLGANAANWVMVLGMLYGGQHALYTMSTQQMTIDKVSAKRMSFFLWVKYSNGQYCKNIDTDNFGGIDNRWVFTKHCLGYGCYGIDRVLFTVYVIAIKTPRNKKGRFYRVYAPFNTITVRS